MGWRENEDEVLSWSETRQQAANLRRHAVLQFIRLHQAFKDRDGDSFLWGDETEYFVVKLDGANRKAYLSLHAQDILQQLQQLPKKDEKAIWKPEFGAFQIEGIPLLPYSGDVGEMLREVEANMSVRRQIIKPYLQPDEVLATLATFPRLGCGVFTDPPTYPQPDSCYGSRSIFISDEAISKAHPRFLAGAVNAPLRRQEKIAINIPIFKDINSPERFVEEFSNAESQAAAKEDHIYMDCMTFGCACSLQVTVQAKNLAQARQIYDNLSVMCPIILALSAASPVHRGWLSQVDCRWDVLSAAKDDRSKEERGLIPLKEDRFVINKSRHDSIDYFLSELGQQYNDVPLIFDQQAYQQLKDAGVDDILSRHVAHLLIRDPITLLRSKVHAPDDPTFTEHFENLQSTNWQSMRLKPPPFHSDIGWRVEFRTCEVQISDYENASYALFLILLTKTIIELDLNLLIPLSKVEENMRVAQKMDAVLQHTFWFRHKLNSECDVNSYGKMSLDAIINGDERIGFAGLVPLIIDHVSKAPLSHAQQQQLRHYLQLISARASGNCKTIARWIRDFIGSHVAYAGDARVDDGVCYDMLTSLLGQPRTPKVRPPNTLKEEPWQQVEAALLLAPQCHIAS